MHLERYLYKMHNLIKRILTEEFSKEQLKNDIKMLVTNDAITFFNDSNLIYVDLNELMNIFPDTDRKVLEKVLDELDYAYTDDRSNEFRSDRIWIYNGKLHRIDGPAIETEGEDYDDETGEQFIDVNKVYYYNGNRVGMLMMGDTNPYVFVTKRDLWDRYFKNKTDYQFRYMSSN